MECWIAASATKRLGKPTFLKTENDLRSSVTLSAWAVQCYGLHIGWEGEPIGVCVITTSLSNTSWVNRL